MHAHRWLIDSIIVTSQDGLNERHYVRSATRCAGNVSVIMTKKTKFLPPDATPRRFAWTIVSHQAKEAVDDRSSSCTGPKVDRWNHSRGVMMSPAPLHGRFCKPIRLHLWNYSAPCHYSYSISDILDADSGSTITPPPPFLPLGILHSPPPQPPSPQKKY